MEDLEDFLRIYENYESFEFLIDKIIKNILRESIFFDDFFDEINNNSNSIKESYIKTKKRLKPKSRNKKNNRDVRVVYVSPSELPSGFNRRTLGMYDPKTHTIYIANNLSPMVERFVYYHELAHSMGIMNERQADAYAASKTGYYLAA